MFEQHLDNYWKSSREMLDIIIYVEGNNTFFYKNLIEFESYFVKGEENKDGSPELHGGLSSSGIISKVAQDRRKGRRSFGLVDNDYKTTFDEYIFPIDFYCLENLSLLKMDEFNLTRERIAGILQENLDVVKLKKIDFEYTRNDENRLEDFQIISTENVHNSFVEYIKERIVCGGSFLKYKDLKIIVEKYSKFHKEKYGKKQEIKYIEDLADRLPSKSLKHVFNESTYDDFQRSISSL